MSVSVTNEPFAFSWAKNNNFYRLSCNAVSDIGSASLYRFTFSGPRPVSGSHIVIVVDGAEYVFTFGSNGGAYDISSVAEIGYKIAQCWYLNQVFYTEGNTQFAAGSKYLNLVGRSAGLHDVQIYTTDTDGFRDGGESDLVHVQLSNPGSNRTEKPNYSIVAIVEVVVNDNNSTLTRECRLVLQPDENGIVDVPLDVIGSLVPQPDIPSTSENGWSLLTNAVLKYRLKYGEMYGNPPQIQSVITSDWKYAICGEVAERFARINLPDWNSGMNGLQFTNNNNVLWVLGEDTNKTVRIERSKPEYLYAMWYNSSLAVNTTRSVTMELYALDANGVEYQLLSTSREVKNGNVYRISVGPSQLDIHGEYYRVVLAGERYSWTRTFLVEHDDDNATTMLLQNKYGVLQCFRFYNIKREIVKESSDTVINKRRFTELNDAYEQYKVNSKLLNEQEAGRIASCLCKQFHYVQCDTEWLRVTIEDGGFLVRDDEPGMVSIEFAFRFVENQIENATNGIIDRGISATVADELGSIVSFSERTQPINNMLL